MAINAVQYLKNVGKSFGYSAIDALKDYNPAITSLASSAKELSTELYDSIQDFKGKAVGTDDEKGFIGKGKDFVKEMRTNLFEDLKTGNWYNKQRIDKVNDEVMGDMFGFDESDFDLDNLDLDLDFDDDEELDAGSAVVSNTVKESTNSIINSMDAVGAKVAGSISTATVNSADYVAKSAKQSAKANYDMTKRGFQQVSTGIAAVNANIATLVTLGEPLTTHMQNSATFYTKSSEYQQAVLEKLDTIIKNTSPEEPAKGSRKTSFGDLFTSEGTLDLAGYFNFVKDNMKQLKEDTVGMFDMLGGMGNVMRMGTASPMKFATDYLTRKAIPDMMKNSMQSFNEALGAFMPAAFEALFERGKKGKFGDIFDFLGDYLMPAKDFKTKIDTSNYNHGRAQWTGESEMALKEVIPTYLSAITSALTGQEMTTYDYKTGKFVTRRAVKQLESTRKTRAARNAGGDFYRDSVDAVKSIGLSKNDEEAIIQQIENYFVNALEKGSNAARKIKEKDFNYNEFGLGEEGLAVLRQVLQSYEKYGGEKKAMSAMSNIRMEQERYSSETRRMESENNAARSIFDNSTIIMNGPMKKDKDGNLVPDKDTSKRNVNILGLDQYNRDVFFYLQGIYSYTQHVSNNLGYLATGSAYYYSGNKRMKKIAKNTKMYRPELVALKEAPDRGETQEEWEKSHAATEKKYMGETNEEAASKKTVEELSSTIAQTVDKSIQEKQRFDNNARGGGERTRKKANDDAKRRELEDKREYAVANGLSTEEIDAQLDELNTPVDKWNALVENHGLGKRRGAGKDLITERIQKIFATPTKIMSDILAAGEDSMYRLIYGKEGSEENGLFGYFFKKSDSLFNKFNDWFKEKVGKSTKDWAKDTFGGLGEDMKNSGKEAMGWIGQRVGDVLGVDLTKKKKEDKKKGEGETEPKEGAADKIKNSVEAAADAINQQKNGGAARGRNVTKTGVVAVSEGEFIVPAKYNPYYNGPVRSTSSQLANEKAAARQYFGSYAEGGTVNVARGYLDTVTHKIYRTMSEVPEEARERVTWISGDETVKQARKDNRAARRKDNYDALEEDGGLNVKNLFKASMSKIGEGIEATADAVSSKTKDKDGEGKIIDKIVNEENRQRLKDADIKGEAKNNKGAIGVGALTGAGVSLLTGAVVGPFLGAAIGGATGLIVKSDKVQKALFGDIDEETGKRKGGILGEKVSNFMTKELPGMGIGGGIGAIAGSLMGSPILGAFVGAGIGFATKSEKVQKALFGGEDENGNFKEGLIKKDTQKRLKKALPNMGAGALAGLFIGPFGPVGNIILGSAIGYATTSEKFKDAVLGKVNEKTGKREGGIVGEFKGFFVGYTDKEGKERQGIFESIKGIFQKVGNEIQIHSKNIFGSLSKAIRSALANSVKNTMKQRMANSKVGKAAKRVGNAALNVAKSPFRIVSGGLERMDKNLSKRALKKGYNVKNKEGKNMKAEERLALRDELGLSTKQGSLGSGREDVNYDLFLQGASQSDLGDLRKVLNYYLDPTKQFDDQLTQNKTDLSKFTEEAGVSPELGQALNRLAAGKAPKGDLKRKSSRDILDMAEKEGLSEEDRKTVEGYLRNIDEAKRGKIKAKTDREWATKQLQGSMDKYNKLGFDIGSDSEIRQKLALLDAEESARFGEKSDAEKEEDRKDKQDQANDATIEIENIVKDIRDVLMGKRVREGDEKLAEDGKEVLTGESESAQERLKEWSKKKAYRTGQALKPVGDAAVAVGKGTAKVTTAPVKAAANKIKYEKGLKDEYNAKINAEDYVPEEAAFADAKDQEMLLKAAARDYRFERGLDTRKDRRTNRKASKKLGKGLAVDEEGSVEGKDVNAVADSLYRRIVSDASGIKATDLATVSKGEFIIDEMNEDEQEIYYDGNYAEGGTVSRSGGSKNKGPGFLSKIYDLVRDIHDKIVGNKESKSSEGEGELLDKDGNVVTPGSGAKYDFKERLREEIDRILSTTPDPEGGQDTGLADDNDNVIQKATEDGVVQYIKDKDGDMVENTSDPGTKAVLEAREEKRKGFAAMPKMAGILGGISGTLGGLGAKLFGGKEKKKGIFASLLESLTGEGSFLGGIFGIFSKLFGGSGIVKAGKSVLSVVKGLAPAAAISALLIGAFGGKFDTLISKLTGGSMSDNSETTATTTSGEEVTLATDDDGNYITNDEGQYLTEDGTYEDINFKETKSDQDTSLSSGMRKNLVTGTITGRGSVGVTGAAAVVKSVAKTVSKVTGNSNSIASAKGTKAVLTATGEAATKLATTSYDTIMSGVSKFLELIPKIMSKVPGLKQFAGKADDLVTLLYSHMDDAIKAAFKKASNTLKSVAEKMSAAMPYIRLAIAVDGALDGWTNASTILGISVEASNGQKCIAALINAINASIPMIGNLIPTATFVDIFMKIAPKIGIDVSGLEEEREQAEADLEAYQEETGDEDATLQDLNDAYGNTGWYHKGRTKVVNAVKSVGTNIKEKGLIKTVKDYGATAANKLKNAGSTVTEKLSTVGGKIKDTASNVFDSIKNNAISQGYQSMLKTAISGEIGTLINSQLIDTSDEESESGAMAKIVNGTLGTISKIQLVPLAAICKIGVSIKNAVTGIIDKIKNGFSLFQQSFKDTTELFTSDDESITLSDVFDTSKYEDEDNPLNGFQVGLINLARFLSVGVLVVKRIGRAIAKPFKKLANKISGGVQRIDQETDAIKELALDANIKGAATYTVTDDEENPINGFQKAIVQLSKIVWVPVSVVLKVGKSVKTGITALIDKITNGSQNIATHTEAIKELANEGEVIDTATYTVEDDDENPVGGFQKAIIQMSKIVWVPVSVVRKIGSSVKTGINELIDRVATGVENITDQTDAMRDLAKEGDVSGVVHYTIEDDDENPIGGFAKGIVQLSKIVYAPIAIVHKVGSAFNTAITDFTDNVSSDSEALTDATDDLKDYAEDGKPKKVFSVEYNGKNSILSPLFKGVFAMEKLMYGISAIFNGMFSSIGKFFTNLFDGENGDGLLSKFKTWLNNDTDSDTTTSTETGGNSGLRRQVGGASNIDQKAVDTFISQTDNKYGNIEFGRSNIADVGCGPAAATMLMNYTNPGTITMKDAIKEARKYEDPDGTSADYFENVLSDYGMSSTYMDASTKKGQNSLKTALASGQPAILLGQNLNNDSKTTSPFGPNKHYVTATGFDSNGNVIINDPESTETKAYDPKILKSVSLGIGTDMPTDIGDTSDEVGGSGYKDNETTQNIWAYFKNAGYSDAAVAGIMGNIYAESNFDPAVLQSGKGPAAGLFQWESYTKNSGRFKSLSDYASSKGLKWSDLDAQLPFANSEIQSLSSAYWQGKGGAAKNLTKAGATATTYDEWKNSTDVAMATRQFEAAFERAGKPAIDKRISAATNYYNLYSGKTYTYTGNADSSSSSSSSDSSSDSYTIFDIVSAIGSALSSALTGSGDSSSSSSSDSSSSGTYTSVSGTASGNVSSNAENAEKQKSLVNKMYSIAGTLKYAQNNSKYPGSRNPDDGSGDCSSTVQWAYKNVLGVDPGSCTTAQRTDSDTYTVATSTQDESKLQLGDLLLKNGHVEMYSGNGKMIGHGGGSDGKTKGPTEKALNQKSGVYNLVRRWTGFKGGNSGLDDVTMPSVDRIEGQNRNGKVIKFSNYTGGASGTSSSSNTDTNTIIKLLKSILQEAKNIVTNTEDISTISDNIINYAEALEEMKSKVTSGSSSKTSNANKSSVSTNVSPEDDPGIQDLVETLNAIAAG